jgi:hypothetical protein
MDQRRKTYLIISISILAVLGLGALITRGFLFPKPTISSIEPQIAAPGDVLVIYGRGFGELGPEAALYINSLKITNSQIIEWGSNQISLILPDGVESGPVELRNRGEISNIRLFTSEFSIPRLAQTQAIETVENQIKSLEAFPEQFISIPLTELPSSRNFSLFLSSVFSKSQKLPVYPSSNIYLNDQNSSIHFPWPSWARDGSLTFVNQLDSNNQEINLKLDFLRAGTIDLDNEQIHNFSFSPSLDQLDSLIDSILEENPDQYFVLKVPTSHTSDYSFVSSVKLGLGQEKLTNDTVNSRYTSFFITRDQLAQLNDLVVELEIHNFESQVVLDVDNIPYVYPNYEHLVFQYTNPVISNEFSEENRAEVWEINESSRHPSTKVKKIYTWITDKYTPIYTNRFQNFYLNRDENFKNSFSYASHLLSWYRELAIPSRLISGYLEIAEQNYIPHFWVEVFYPNFGWVGIDAAMGDGLYASIPGYPEDAFNFYRGDSDGLHIPLHSLDELYIDIINTSDHRLSDEYFSYYLLLESANTQYPIPLRIDSNQG